MLNYIKFILSKIYPLSHKNYKLDLDRGVYDYGKLINQPNDELINLNFKELSILFQTDKSKFLHSVVFSSNENKYVRSILQSHNYAEYYENYFKHVRKDIKNIIEIGTLTGSSTVVFYFYFCNSKIYCLDIDFSSNKIFSSRIVKQKVDQSNTKQIRYFLKKYENIKFDIIVDDGSHKEKDIISTFREFFNYIQKNGFYIIEDVCYENQPKVLEIFDALINKNGLNQNDFKDIDLNKIISVEKFKSNQNYFNINRKKTLQQYIIFIKFK